LQSEAYLVKDLAARPDARKVVCGKLDHARALSFRPRFCREDKVAHPIPGPIAARQAKSTEGRALNLKLMSLRSVDFLEQTKKSFYKPSFRAGYCLARNWRRTMRSGFWCHNTKNRCLGEDWTNAR